MDYHFALLMLEVAVARLQCVQKMPVGTSLMAAARPTHAPWRDHCFGPMQRPRAYAKTAIGQGCLFFKGFEPCGYLTRRSL